MTTAQKNYTGYYKNYFGNSIELKNESTFKFTWKFDCSGSWTIGSWAVKNDTIYFTAKPIYDTLKQFNQETNSQIDTLVLSLDEKSNRITSVEFAINEITSGGQNKYQMPSSLFFRNERLYEIGNYGRLIKKKRKEFWSNKKYNSWYFRQE